MRRQPTQRLVGHVLSPVAGGERNVRRNRMRSSVAEAVGLTLEEFDEKAPEALRSAQAIGNFPDLDAITILQTGSGQ